MYDVLQIARVCHAANRELQFVNGDPSPSPEWDEAPEWQRESAADGVRHELAGDRTPEQAHEDWCAAKVAAGWSYGEVKDGDARTHPCLVPYGHLPEGERRKDALLQAIVAALR